MLNTHKLFVMFIALNLVLGVLVDFWGNPSDYNALFSRLSNEQSGREDFATQFEREADQDNPASSSTTILESDTSGSTRGMGNLLFDVALKGLSPYPFGVGSFDTYVEQILVTVLILFRSIMYVLLGLELYMLIKNRGTGR